MAKHLEKAREKMTEEGVAKTVSEEMVQLKMAFEQGNWRASIASARKILSVRPDHIEAAAYLEDAEKRLNEPIDRALKIARAKFERGEYLDSIRICTTCANWTRRTKTPPS
jgi:hypothetical protein